MVWGRQRIPSALANDYAYCQDIVRANYENFPVGSLLAPARIRHHLHAVYAFARLADDIADTNGSDDDEKLTRLDEWERRLDEALHGRADHPIFRALGHTLRETGLSPEPLRNLLVAFRMDVTNKQYETLEELFLYCRYSANPVGRIVLHFGGYSDAGRLAQSDAICTALQLTNHWQDLSEDPWMGRPLYLPRQEMSRFGVAEETIRQRRFSPAVAELMLHLIDETRRLYREGEPLLKQVSWPLNLELSVIWSGGMAVLEQIEAMGGNTLRQRPSLDTRAKMGCLLRGLGKVCS
uniref:Putative Squalene/phytoene synthase n=1 Tax=Magnetococcus massalia (strain MO-1) TaxID=451514 RepID=A0A1S7LMG2_MAGMO|nr:Putative Squalene/phytoene synthase [Candidatus Magnetococcus massalia]